MTSCYDVFDALTQLHNSEVLEEGTGGGVVGGRIEKLSDETGLQPSGGVGMIFSRSGYFINRFEFPDFKNYSQKPVTFNSRRRDD